MIFVFVFELIGTIAFAISGALIAIEKKMDLLGVAILGMTTAVGGGIIRDIIINTTPPVAFQQPVYALLAIAVSIAVFIPAVRSRMDRIQNLLLIMDSIGLGVFTVVGVRAGISFDNLFLSVFLGTLTGVGGGVMRDLFAGEKPYIFVKHFYACASMTGALVSSLMWPLGERIAMPVGAVIVIVLRLYASKYRWSLPKA